MDHKKNTPPPNKDATEAHHVSFGLSEEELQSPTACEKSVGYLREHRAGTLRVYEGRWEVVPDGKAIIKTDKLLCSQPQPEALREWLNTRGAEAWTTPIIIEAEFLPQVQEPELSYKEEIANVLRMDLDFGQLTYEDAWSSVRRLAEVEAAIPHADRPVELHREREELKQIIRDKYPESAEQLRLTATRTDQNAARNVDLTKRETGASAVLRKAQSTPIAATQHRAKFVEKVLSELRSIKPKMHNESCFDEMAREYPTYSIFKVARAHRDVKTWIENIQERRDLIKLAQEIAARHFGKSEETLATDWSHRKKTRKKAL